MNHSGIFRPNLSNDFTYKNSSLRAEALTKTFCADAAVSDNFYGVRYLIEKSFGDASGSPYNISGGGKKKYKSHVVTSLFSINLEPK